MLTYKADRPVRVLSGLATALYFLTWIGTVVILAWVPVAKVLAANGYEPSSRSVSFGVRGVSVSEGVPKGRFLISAPVRLHPALDTTWRTDGGVMEVSEVRATASVPIASLSAGFVALVWAAAAVLLALVLLFLRELRRLFRRVRQGTPFDPGNAPRLRWLGMLLLGAAVWIGLTDFWMSVAISRKLEGAGSQLGTGLYLNLPLICVALVLIALAEIFRRGAALEEEQSLVV